MQKKKTKLITIAGPQSSGKTDTLEIISKYFPKFPIYFEVNPYSVVSKNHLGAAFTDSSLTKKIADIDIKNIRKIPRDNKIHILETGILHLCYLEHICSNYCAEKYLKKYILAQKNFHSIIIFIDTKPEISWKRRKPIYLKRIKDNIINGLHEKKITLNKYRKIIYDLYPLWLKYYHKAPFEKYMIKNSCKSYSVFKKELIDIIRKLTV